MHLNTDWWLALSIHLFFIRRQTPHKKDIGFSDAYPTYMYSLKDFVFTAVAHYIMLLDSAHLSRECVSGEQFEKLKDRDDQGWCTGRKSGRVGLYPDNYVKFF